MNTTHFMNTIMNSTFYDKTFYVGLSSTRPTSGGTGYTEPDAATYSRVEFSSFTEASGGIVSNASDIVFQKTVQDWFVNGDKAAYWLLFDGIGSSAHLLSGGQLITEREIPYNVTVTIPANALKIRLFDSFEDLEDGE